jgi:hypothetical protein
VSVTVPEVELPQLTLIALEVEEPFMLPPVTDHEYVLPAKEGTEYDAPVNRQTELGPLMTGVGFPNSDTFIYTVESQASGFVTVNVTIPKPALPHETIIALPFEGPLMLPFVIAQLYVLPALAPVE